MIFVNTSGDSDYRTSCILIPVWCPESRKCRHHITSVGIRYLLCHILGILSTIYKSHLISEPLDRSSCDKDRTFKCVVYFSSNAPCKGCNKSVFRKDRLFSRIHKKEASCSICILRITFTEALLSEESRLLIARNSGNRNLSA